MTCLYLFNRTIVNPDDILFAEPAMLYQEDGSTGTRIMATLINGLQTKDKQFGLESMCVGGGQGMAILVERLS